MEDRGPQRLLALAYGNHPKSAALKPEAVKVIRTLRESPKKIEELAAVLGLDLAAAADRKHFYVLMRPMRDMGMVATRRLEGKRVYYLSSDGFNQYLKEIRKEAEYWLATPTA
ncbi:MAG: helix-turn-helix domain-containing protein [Candidatus Hadarchaeota archaeon]